MSDVFGAVIGAASAAQATRARDRHPPFAETSGDVTTELFWAFLGTAGKAATGVEQAARLEHNMVYACALSHNNIKPML